MSAAQDIATQLRGAGKRMTTQRQQVLELLDTCAEPVDASELYLLAQQFQPVMSLSTIYRNLQVLVDLGAVMTVDLGDTHIRYTLKRANEAQHLVCQGCNRIIQLDSPVLHQLCEALAREHQFVLTDMRLVLRGHCNGDHHTCGMWDGIDV